MKTVFSCLLGVLFVMMVGGCARQPIDHVVWQRQGSLRIETKTYQGWLKFAWAGQGKDFFCKITDWSNVISVFVKKTGNQIWVWNHQQLIEHGTVNEVLKQQFGKDLPWLWLNDVLAGDQNESQKDQWQREVIYRKNVLKKIILQDQDGKLTFYL